MHHQQGGAAGQPPPSQPARPILSLMLWLLLLLLGSGALAMDVDQQVGGELLLIASGTPFGCTDMLGRLFAGDDAVCYRVFNRSTWLSYRQPSSRPTGWDFRRDSFFTNDPSLSGPLVGMPQALDFGPLGLPSTRTDPLFLWQSGSQVGLSVAGQSHTHALPAGQPAALLAGHANGPDEVTALVLVEGADASLNRAHTLRWRNQAWLATDAQVPHPRAPGATGLPGNFFLATADGWAWIRPGSPTLSFPLGRPVVALAATRFLTPHLQAMDLVVTTADRLYVYLGLDPGTGTWAELLEAGQLPEERQALTTRLVPPVQDATLPTRFLLLVSGTRQMWRLVRLSTGGHGGDAGPAGGQLLWQAIRLPATFATWPDVVRMAPVNLGPARPEYWVLFQDNQAYHLADDMGCDSDPSIRCDRLAATWACAPGRLEAPHLVHGQLCGACGDGFFRSPAPRGSYECRPCLVAGCQVCSDAGESCSTCQGDLLLVRGPPGQPDSCVETCPGGLTALGRVCGPSLHPQPDLHVATLDNRIAGGTGVSTFCASRTYLKAGRLHVSNASLAAREPESLLASLASSSLGMLDVQQMRQDPLAPVVVTPVQGMPLVPGVEHILEMGPFISDRRVSLLLLVDCGPGCMSVIRLACTLPGTAPADECQLQARAWALDRHLLQRQPVQKLTPSVVSFGHHVAEFQADGSLILTGPGAPAAPSSLAMGFHRDVATGRPGQMLYTHAKSSTQVHAISWDIRRRMGLTTQALAAAWATPDPAPQAALLRPEAPASPCGRATAAATAGPGQGQPPGQAQPAIGTASSMVSDLWVLVSLATRPSGTPPASRSEDIVHTGLLTSGGQVHWGAVHRPLGAHAQGRVNDIPGGWEALAPVAGITDRSPFFATGVALRGSGEFPSALVMVSQMHLGVVLLHCPAGVATCRLGPRRVVALPPSQRLLPASGGAIATPLPGAWPPVGEHAPGPAAALLLSPVAPYTQPVLLVRVSVADCPARTFGPGCQPCDASCQGCTGPGPGECTGPRCAFFRPSQPDACLDACPAGLHPDAEGACGCHADCAACHLSPGRGQYICTACRPGMALDPAAQPPDRCRPCHASCSECHAPASATACQACPSGGLLGPAGVCAAACPAGTWPDHAAGTCVPCPGNCAACTGPDFCTACQPSPLPDPASGWCVACFEQCAQCQGSLDACLACRPGFRWAAGAPPAGPDQTAPCVPCPEGCAECADDGGCLSCRPGFLIGMDPGTCVSRCPDGTAAHSPSRACRPCHQDCGTCFQPGDGKACNACAPGKFLQPTSFSCLDTCPQRYYPGSGACIRCGPLCQACSGPGKCDRCEPGRFDPGDGSCALCPDSCATCSGPAACDACQGGLVFLSPDPAVGSLCGDACPAGSYPGPDRCLACGTACARCAGDAHLCEACAPGHRWAGHPPAAGSGLTGSCVPCPAHCDVCTADDECLACDAGFFRRAQNGACVAACPPGEYPEPGSAVCRACDATCGRCAGPAGDQCTGCAPGSVLSREGRCIESCPAGQYPGQAAGGAAGPAAPPELQCLACSPACDRCDGPGEGACTACPAPRLLEAGRCVDQCGPGHFACAPAGRCAPCPDGCAACQPAEQAPTACRATCTGCHAGMVLSPGTGRCGAFCPPGEFLPRADALECAPCGPSCAACHGQADRCTVCADAAAWLRPDTGHCLESCPEAGFAVSPAESVCLACASNCDRCTAPPDTRACTLAPDGRLDCPAMSACDRCAPGYLLLAGGSCVADCPAGHFPRWDASPGVCAPCHPKCAGGCTGPEESHCDRPAGHSPASQRLAIGLGIGFGLLFLLMFLALILFLMLRLRRDQGLKELVDELDEVSPDLGPISDPTPPGTLRVDLAADFTPLRTPLGTGRHSTIFAARAVGGGTTTRLGCPDIVAIKLMKADAPDADVARRLQNEIALMWLLRDQDNIVRMYGYSDSPPALVMQQYQTDLGRLVHSRADVPLGDMLHICHQWAAGLDAMHNAGVAHCHFGPDKILVAPAGPGSWLVAVGDLAASRNLRHPPAEVAPPAPGPRRAAYTAPEVLLAAERQRPLKAAFHLPADVFAAAVVLWECLTRAIPWEGSDADTIKADVRSGRRPDMAAAVAPLRQQAPTFVQATTNLLNQAWDEDPLDRPSAMAIHQLCAAILAALP
ncbi:TKL protein kinase [Fonticula alba]|uniref:TKL protein kinase n=1 Tax=Fonticula alba TaxID=691883 RepID=A0A058Z692_FONAL|nr:TKL protein kinase [Fonticula alba]KCV69790.1 TKL protein kinase [Fonticula alba]|eukprot:XP_009495396.1 TKL protein kinase [Fonticula alba]